MISPRLRRPLKANGSFTDDRGKANRRESAALTVCMGAPDRTPRLKRGEKRVLTSSSSPLNSRCGSEDLSDRTVWGGGEAKPLFPSLALIK